MRPIVFTLACLAALAPWAEAQQPFVPFEARSVAMGGAAVGMPEGSGSGRDNPASIASGAKLHAVASGGGVGTESGDFFGPLRTIAGADPTQLAGGTGAAAATAALRTLAEPGNGVLGTGRVGVALVSKGFSFGLARDIYTGSFARADLVHVETGNDPTTSYRYNTSAGGYRGLTVDDLFLGSATSLVPGVRVGATAHLLRGTTTAYEESAFGMDVTDAYQMARRGTSGAERRTTRFAWDGGVLLTAGVVSVGGVLRAVNRPSFPYDEAAAPAADRGGEARLGRQARVGASVRVPGVGLLFAADLDLSTNDTLVPGLRSREVGGGLEWTLALIQVRGGLRVNLEDPARAKVFSAGAGLGLGPIHADAAVIYRPDRSALGAVVTARVGL